MRGRGMFVDFIFKQLMNPVPLERVKQIQEKYLTVPRKPMFSRFPKIPRLNRECVITEKLDGMNASVIITIEGNVYAASRNGYITPEKDCHGFAKWVEANKKELLKLGKGTHFGEFYGQGINRNYGLKEKRFALFNVTKWGDPNLRPKCCEVVPVLEKCQGFNTKVIEQALDNLRELGSKAVPGYRNPEGIVIYHEQGNHLYKVSLENDKERKSETKERRMSN